MTQEVCRVTRKLYPQTYIGSVRSRYGAIDVKSVFLEDAVRHQMGGEEQAFFMAEMKDGKVVVFNRVPDPGWNNPSA